MHRTGEPTDGCCDGTLVHRLVLGGHLVQDADGQIPFIRPGKKDHPLQVCTAAQHRVGLHVPQDAAAVVPHTVELRGFVASAQQVDTLKQRAHLVWSKNNLLAAKCQQGIFGRGLFRRGCREQQPGFRHQLHGAYPADKSLDAGVAQLHIQHDDLRVQPVLQ